MEKETKRKCDMLKSCPSTLLPYVQKTRRNPLPTSQK